MAITPRLATMGDLCALGDERFHEVVHGLRSTGEFLEAQRHLAEQSTTKPLTSLPVERIVLR